MSVSIAADAIWVLLCSLLSYLLYTAFYRLFISPLAKIPGPKIAAITGCYEMYYDLIGGARFPWKIEQLHRTYGPIVRIAPAEVHINDTAYADTHFSSSSSIKHSKYKPYQRQFDIPTSVISTIDPGLHKARRAAINPFFSKRRVASLEPMIQSKVEKVCLRLDSIRGSGKAINLRLLFTSMTTDITGEFTYSRGLNLLDKPDLTPILGKDDELALIHWLKHFPFIYSVLGVIPSFHSLVTWYEPELKALIDWEKSNQKQLKDVLDIYKTAHHFDQKSHDTIFHEILQSNLPPEEKSHKRLLDESTLVMAAGIETASNTLRVTACHLLSNPSQLARLREELEDAIPDSTKLPHLQQLENLPYLTAVINEGLRVSIGITTRFIRVAAEQDLKYKDWTLPAGTAVSMSAMLLHQNPEVFPDPGAFLPERWLDKNTRADLFTFSKGPRICAGINLAYAELYQTLAAVFRRFDLKLFETTIEDVTPVADAFNPRFKSDSKGVRVIVC